MFKIGDYVRTQHLEFESMGCMAKVVLVDENFLVLQYKKRGELLRGKFDPYHCRPIPADEIKLAEKYCN